MNKENDRTQSASAQLDTRDAFGPHAGQRLRIISTCTPHASSQSASSQLASSQSASSQLASKPRAAAIFMHGRGSNAADILTLVPRFIDLAVPTNHFTSSTSDPLRDFLFIAPEAANNSWYPQSFLSPLSINQRGIDSAHAVIESLIAQLATQGVDSSHIALIGFSQGACLVTDHACRFPRRYGAILAFTGGLIGPPATIFPASGSLDSTPIFLGTNDPDPHIPLALVHETAAHLRSMGAEVELKIYPGMPHAVLDDEIQRGSALLARIANLEL